MYNRYIPQNDGSYRKNRVNDPPRPGVQLTSPPRPSPQPPDGPPRPSVPSTVPCPPPDGQSTPLDPIGMRQFLHRLLPNGFDTEDLIVVLLLLLISGGEEKNHALLTLAIYLFL